MACSVLYLKFITKAKRGAGHNSDSNTFSHRRAIEELTRE